MGRDVALLAALGGTGWLLAGWEGAIVAVPAAVVGRMSPRLVLGYATGALAFAAFATIVEGGEGGSDQDRFWRFVADRPVAASLGRIAGMLAIVGLVSCIVQERATSRRSAAQSIPTPWSPSSQPGLLGRLRGQANGGHRHLVTGSGLVMAAFVVQAATGLVFWILAARRFDQETVGISAGLMASLQFINYLTAFGLPELLSRHRPLAHRPDTLFTWSMTLTSAGSAAGCLVYLLVVSSDSTTLLLDGGAVGLLVFYLCVTGAAIGLLADLRLMSQRRWHLVLARLGISGVIRLPLLLTGPGPFEPALWLFAISAGPLALSAVPATAAALRHHGMSWRRASLGIAPDAALRYAGVNHAAHLAVFAPQFVLPVIVLANVTAEDNAVFYVAWNITAVVTVLPVTVGRVLLVEGSRALGQLWESTRAALAIAAGIATAALVGCLAFRWVLPVVYGGSYREAATLVVPLVAGSVPWSLTSVALGAFRVRADGHRLLVTTAVLAGGVLGLAAFTVPSGGTAAAAWAWVAGNVIGAVVAGALLVSRWRSEQTGDAAMVEVDPETVASTRSGGATAT